MKPNEVAKRYLLFIISLFLMGIGIALAKTAALGVSPISSVPNVLSLRFPALSIGDWLFLWNVLLITGQILILRKKFQPIQLLQIPCSFLLGWFTDIGMWICSFVPIERYAVRLAMVLLCVIFLGIGIALAITANVVMNAGEGFVKAIADTCHRQFGHIKIAFDLINVTLSILLSLLLFDGAVAGTREGTVICAVCTGFAVQFFIPKFRFFNRLLAES